MADVPDDLLKAAVAALRKEGLAEPVDFTDDFGTAETVAYIVLKAVFEKVDALREALVEAEAKLTEANRRLSEQLVERSKTTCTHPLYFRQGAHCTLCGRRVVSYS